MTQNGVRGEKTPGLWGDGWWMDGWITIRTGGSLTLSITLSLRSLEFSQHRVEKMLREGKSKPLSGEPPSLVYSHGRASLSHSAVCLRKVWPVLASYLQ